MATEPRRAVGDDAHPAQKSLTVYGRQGSPTITVALPFSHVRMAEPDTDGALTEVVELVRRLAEVASGSGSATTRAELRRVAADAADLLDRL